MNTPSFSSMSDADLEASLSDDAPAADTGSTGDADAGAAAAEQADQTEGDAGTAGTAAPDQTPNPNPDPATDTKPQQQVPVSELIATRKRAQAAEAQLAAIQAQQAEAARKAAEAQTNQQWNDLYQQKLDEGDVEGAADVARQYYAAKAQDQQATAQQQAQHQTLQTAAEVGVEVYGQDRYVGAIQRLYNEFGPEWVDRKAAEQGSAVKAAKWAVEFAEQKLAPDAATFDKRVQEEARKLAQEILAKQQQPDQGHQTIGLVSSGTHQPPVEKHPRKMSDKELERSLRD